MTPNSTPNVPSDSNSLSKRQLYRRLMYGSILVGVAGSLVLRSLDYPLAGEAVYLLGFLAFLGIWRGTSMTLFDERDKMLERRASTITLTLFAFVLILGASGVRVLSAVGTYAVPPEFVGALWGFVAQFVVFGLVYVGVRYRR